MDITIKLDPLSVHNAVAGLVQLQSETVGGLARRLAETGALAERLAGQLEDQRRQNEEQQQQFNGQWKRQCARIDELTADLELARKCLAVEREQLDRLRCAPVPSAPDSGPPPEGTQDEPPPPSGMPGDGF